MITIVGMKKVNFKSKDGSDISGVTFYTTDDGQRSVEGAATDKFFLSERKVREQGPFALGDNVKLYYNRYGKIDEVEIL